MSETFEPHITAFVCNWCTYTGADLAGTSRLQMAPNVRIVRLPCSGRVDPVLTELLEFMGIDPRRVTFSWVSASEGAKWKEIVDGATARAREAGPFTQYRALAEAV